MESTVTKDLSKVTNILGNPYNVILFNDYVHPFDAVVAQVMKATGCAPANAMAITLNAHTQGKAVAFTGYKERCEVVESILSGPPLKLKTAIESAA